MKHLCVVLGMLVAVSASAQWSRSSEALPSAARGYGSNVREVPSSGGVILSPTAGGVYVTDSYCYGPTGIDTPVSATYTLRSLTAPFPMTVEAYIIGPLIARSKSYNAGDVVVAESGVSWPPDATEYVYRAQNSGTTAALSPTLSITKGGTTADGGVTWVNLGPDLTMQPIAPTSSAVAYSVNAVVPAHSNVLTVGFGLWFATVAAPVPPPPGSQVELSDVSIPGATFCK